MKPYSNDLRQKVVDAYERDEGSMQQLARRFAVSLNFVWLLIERYRQTGRVDPKPHGGGQKRKLDTYQEVVLEELVAEHVDATLAELAQLLYEKTGARVSVSTVGLTLRRRGITRKKKTSRASEGVDDKDVECEREHFAQAQRELDVNRQVVIDEAGVNLGLARRYARAPRGCRAVDDKPFNPGPNLSLVGALGADGVRAIMMIEGAVNGPVFIGFLEQRLAPVLKPGDQVWLDNLSVHKVDGVADVIEAQQAQLHYLPRYSPEFSPMELCWSKLKAWLRGAAPRTMEALEGEIRNALDDITQSDINGWFAHCGYHIEPN